MPPRIPAFQCLRAQNTSQCHNASRAFSSTPSSQASTVTQKRRHRDPYAIAQTKARKAANLSRQEVLKKERASTLGDPVRGNTTPFVRSFDTALSPEPSPPFPSTQTRTKKSPVSSVPGSEHLNFYVSKKELESAISRSKWLTQPLPREAKEEEESQDRDLTVSRDENSEFDLDTSSQLKGMFDSYGSGSTIDDSPEAREERMNQDHETAREALRRISSLSLGSSKDRLRANMERCIDVFGRHNTDQTLPPRLQAVSTGNEVEKTPRCGPDTGSSEVQIAILTAKIRALADGLELRGHPDKVNKRNLRLLVHRRAKLLNYLRRKERGGPRWQNLIETLGLTEGTWKGEISM